MYNHNMNIKDFELLLLDAGLTLETFSTKTKIPLATINNWFAKRQGKTTQEPKWVQSYIEMYIENKKNKNIIEYLEDKLNAKN